MSVKLQLQNKLINGGFDFWQRGVSISTSGFMADRWFISKLGTYNFTLARSTDVPSGSSSSFSLGVTCTLAQVSTPTYGTVLQGIEGNVLRSFRGKKMAVSFWVKSGKVGVHSVGFRNNGYTRCLVKEYTVSAADTWEKKTIRFTHDESGSWSYDTALGLQVLFNFTSTTIYNTAPDVWTVGDYFSSTAQVNVMDTLNAVFKIADIVMIEDNEGQTRVPDFMYAGRDIFEELQLCRRYYEYLTGWGGNAASTTMVEIGGTMVPKRVGPLISTSGSITIRCNIGSPDVTAVTPVAANFGVAPLPPYSAFWGQISGFAGLLANTPIQDRQQNSGLRADAEL